MRLGTGAAMEGRSGLISFTVPVVPVVAVPLPKPKDKAPTMLTSLWPVTASMLLPAPLVVLPTVKEINPPRPSVPAFADRIKTLPLLVAVPSPKPNDKAPPVFTVLPPAMAPMLPPAPLVLLPTVGEIDLPRPSMASPVPNHTAPMLPLDALPDENPNTLENILFVSLFISKPTNYFILFFNFIL
jgi:hypothetical protein